MKMNECKKGEVYKIDNIHHDSKEFIERLFLMGLVKDCEFTVVRDNMSNLLIINSYGVEYALRKNDLKKVEVLSK